MKKKILWILLALILIGAIAWIVVNKVNKYTVEFKTDPSDVTLEYGDSFDEAEVKAVGYGTIFSKNPVDLEVRSEGSVDITKVGKYTITYVAEFKGVKNTIDCTVNVVDTQPPVIRLVSDPEHFTSPIAAYEEEGFEAVDAYDGDITDQVTRKVNDNGTVTYTVKDSSGNKATATREIVYKDVVAPAIILPEETVYIEQGRAYEDRGFTAVDDVDGDITDSVTFDASTVNVKKPGNYAITYEVKDSYGNVGTAVRTVVVNQRFETQDPGNKVVYLTFDDGPCQYTQQLLDVLDKYGIKATFFVTNQYPDYQYMLAEEAKRGHTVAIHTYMHDYHDIYSDEERYYADLNAMKDIIVQQTGITPTLVRFPGGSSNTISANYKEGIMSSLAASLPSHGYQYVDWNITSGDAGETTETDKIVENVIAGIQENNISVVLQHDIKLFSVEAVESIVKWGLENGYTFLPLTSSSPICHHGINN